MAVVMAVVMLDVRVIPNAAKTGFSGKRDGSMVLRVHAPAREGKANRELVRYIAEFFGVGRSSVRIVRGENSRLKKVEILGLDPASGEARLENLVSEHGEENQGT